MSGTNSLDILLVEDDDIDVLAFRRAATGLHWRIHTVASTEEALAVLHNRSGRAPLVVLDLNLPGLSGHDFLSRLRAEPSGRDVVVIVLTTSRDPRDIAEAWSKHIAGYFAKPLDPADYRDMVVALDRYWSRSETPP